MPQLTRAEVTAVKRLTSGRVELTLRCESLVGLAQPGQFVQVAVGRELDPLLRRPYGFGPLFPEQATFKLYVKAAGRGSELLCAVEPGDELDCLGPLGKPFPLPEQGQRACLVGGGTGLAPMVCLAQKLSKEGISALLLLGASCCDELTGLEDVVEASLEYACATEDGSLGAQGFVTELLGVAEPADVYYACGPVGMMRAVARFAAEAGKPCWVSLEARMACGYGVCASCAVPIGSPGAWEYRKACKDGPVFSAQEVVWYELA